MKIRFSKLLLLAITLLPATLTCSKEQTIINNVVLPAHDSGVLTITNTTDMAVIIEGEFALLFSDTFYYFERQIIEPGQSYVMRFHQECSPQNSSQFLMNNPETPQRKCGWSDISEGLIIVRNPYTDEILLRHTIVADDHCAPFAFFGRYSLKVKAGKLGCHYQYSY